MSYKYELEPLELEIKKLLPDYIIVAGEYKIDWSMRVTTFARRWASDDGFTYLKLELREDTDLKEAAKHIINELSDDNVEKSKVAVA